MSRKLNATDLEAYKGQLSLKEIARGFKLCVMNAEDLLDDAELMVQNKSYARAASLIILSEEEAAKTLMLATAATLERNDANSWSKFWKRLRKHEAKQRDLLLFDLIMCESVSPKDTALEIRSEFLERLKQLGFYVDNIDGNFISPRELFANKKLRNFVKLELGLARNRLEAIKEVSDRIRVTNLEKLNRIANKLRKTSPDMTPEEYAHHLATLLQKIAQAAAHKKRGQ